MTSRVSGFTVTSTSPAQRSRSARPCASTPAVSTRRTCCAERSSTLQTTAVISTSSSRPVSLSLQMAVPGDDSIAVGASPGPLADPIAEGRRLVAAATRKGLTMRLLGGVGVCVQAPPEGPLLPRTIGDVDLATQRGNRSATTELLLQAGYAGDEMFNVLHGARRLLFYDDANGRKLDVFLGEFSMCHSIPIADRL